MLKSAINIGRTYKNIESKLFDQTKRSKAEENQKSNKEIKKSFNTIRKELVSKIITLIPENNPDKKRKLK